MEDERYFLYEYSKARGWFIPKNLFLVYEEEKETYAVPLSFWPAATRREVSELEKVFTTVRYYFLEA